MTGQKDTAFRSLELRIRDGLKLHARHYPARQSADAKPRRPLLCLAGLTRNGRDFHDLATYLSATGPTSRDVYALDYRGRGLSDWDPDWKNYAVPIETLDVIDFASFAGLEHAAVMGTSRGGLIAMILAAMQPSIMKVAILNDIGPVIETDGLMRIAGYVGRVPLPRTWQEAAEIARDVNQRRFPKVGRGTWEEVARQWYNERDGRPSHGYDPALKNALSVLDGPMPSLWPQFEALSRMPMLVLRGENSDILSEDTVREMRQRHATLEDYTVPEEGHAPLLKDKPTQDVIAGFLARTDAGASATSHDEATTGASATVPNLVQRISA